jgi:glutamate dehydrogenase (NAD(P)+)
MAESLASWAADELGPAKVVFLRLCDGVNAVVVVDNVVLGPAIGGVRMRPDVTVGEVARLAGNPASRPRLTWRRPSTSG